MLGLKFLFLLVAFVHGHTHGPGCSHHHEEVYAHAHDNHRIHDHDSSENPRPTKANPQHHESRDEHEGHNHGHADSFVGQLWDLIKETCPWVMLGLILTGLLQAFPFSTNLIKKHLQPGNSGILSCMKAALVGLLTPLCSCGALPLAIALLDSGCSLRAIVAFLTASQSAGIDSMLITYGLLGPYAMVARLLGAAVLATATGFATTDIQSKPKHGYDPASACCDDDHCEEDKIKQLPVVRRVIHTVLSTFEEVVPWVFLGVIVTAICSIYFPASPPDYEKMLATNDPLSSSLLSTIASRALILIFTLPLQMCEHACVTFAIALQKLGASQGTAFAFLLSAPATNVATLIFLFQRGRATNAWLGGVWTVVRMTGSLVAAGVALSFVFDLLDLKLLRGEKRQANWFWNGDLPAWWEPLSLYMAGGLILCIAVKKLLSSQAHAHKD